MSSFYIHSGLISDCYPALKVEDVTELPEEKVAAVSINNSSKNDMGPGASSKGSAISSASAPTDMGAMAAKMMTENPGQ